MPREPHEPTKVRRMPHQEDAALLKSVMDTVVDGILTIDESGTVITANPAIEATFGYPPGELIGKNVKILMPTPYHEEHDQYLTNFLDTGIKKIIGIGREVTGLRKDGETFPLDLAVGQTRTQGGLIFTGIMRDISKRKTIEAALRASEARFGELLENVELIAIILDMEAKVTFCNDYLLRLTGWTREETIGGDWISRFIPEPDQPRVQQVFDQIHSAAIRTHGENPIRTRAGEIREILWNNTMLRDASGQVVGVASIGQDVTEHNRAVAALRQVLEETERKVEERTAALATANAELLQAVNMADAANMAKSNFLSRMSHEFRTPMNAVLGFGQLLELSITDERQLDNVRQILKGGRHLLGLINDVLEIARIETGSLGISLDKVDLAEVLAESASLMRPMTSERSVRLEVEPLPLVHVVADRQRLRQVVLNLLSNAIKYNVKDGEIKLRATLASPEWVAIEVADTGMGIPKALQERLFVPFERLGAEVMGIEGTGLGLSLSRSLTEAMGGTLTVESTEGVGSCFRVTLAVASLGAPASPELSVGPPVLEGSEQTRKLLVIEDNLTNLELLTQIFERLPHFTLLTAMQGRLGLDLAAEHRPDVILLDLHLPDMSGKDVLHALRADPVLKGTPVIIVSADALGSQTKALLGAGAFRYITKPFVLSHLMAAVEAALESEGVPN